MFKQQSYLEFYSNHSCISTDVSVSFAVPIIKGADSGTLETAPYHYFISSPWIDDATSINSSIVISSLAK